MPALAAGIHAAPLPEIFAERVKRQVCLRTRRRPVAWMAGTGPAMTDKAVNRESPWHQSSSRRASSGSMIGMPPRIG